ncbi:MAG: hypothetical protein ACFFDT_13265 [Candidatus Hodarchaeota archaeon]
MDQRLEKIIKVEWKAQELQKRFAESGPLIERLTAITPANLDITKKTSTPSNYLIIQGSFDPPTLSHLELLSRSINLRKKINPLDSIEVVFLFSLSHVDKKFNVLNRSLLGYRVEMLENLVKTLNLPVSISIGLSNVARYIDLIEAAQQYFKNIKNLTFIMGTDVFKKVLDSHYYSEPIKTILPLIFNADYFVAGRKEVFSKKEFTLYLKNHLPGDYHQKIHFLSLPKHFRFLNATSIRESYSDKRVIQETGIHPVIEHYLGKDNLYRSTSKWMATKITIQLVVQLTLEAEKEQTIANEILNLLLPEVESDAIFQQQLINEYQTEKNREIVKRWNQLLGLIS